MKRAVILCSLLLCLYGASAQDATRPVYLDPSKPTEEQVADLVGRMTPEEKTQQLNHLNVGRPLAVTWTNEHLPAILDAWDPGEAGDTAIAQVLLGDYNPGGHLPDTVYSSLDGVPPQNEYDVSKGFTYLYFKGAALYPFGHGLSYTQFKHSNLKLSQTTTNASGEVDVLFDLQNTGSRAGSEVTQMYVHQTKPNVVQPIKSLRVFQRIMLEPDETKHFPRLSFPTTMW